MSPEEVTRIQNEVFTTIVISELQKQKDKGVKIGDYILDKYEIDKLVAEKLKEILNQL